jgi:hypothetical protein
MKIDQPIVQMNVSAAIEMAMIESAVATPPSSLPALHALVVAAK